MAKFGGFGKFPLKLGGEPSHQQKAYTALRTIVGEGGSPPEDPLGETTFDGIWRRAKANALGAIASVTNAAVWQAFPHTVTDELRTYEEIVLSYLPAGAPDESRRQAVLEKWLAPGRGNYPALTEYLKALDERFSVLLLPHEQARYTFEGKVFDVPGNVQFSQYHDHSSYPSFADTHVVTALFDVGESVPPAGTIGNIKARAEATLSESLPAWNDFAMLLDVGFTLDLSLLDVTGFSP